MKKKNWPAKGRSSRWNRNRVFPSCKHGWLSNNSSPLLTIHTLSPFTFFAKLSKSKKGEGYYLHPSILTLSWSSTIRIYREKMWLLVRFFFTIRSCSFSNNSCNPAPLSLPLTKYLSFHLRIVWYPSCGSCVLLSKQSDPFLVLPGTLTDNHWSNFPRTQKIVHCRFPAWKIRLGVEIQYNKWYHSGRQISW